MAALPRTVPVMLVEPVPLIVWFKVPSVRVKMLEFVTIPPIFEALVAREPESEIFIA